MEEHDFSWIAIALLCVQLFGFIVKLLYSAVFGWRRRIQQPLSYPEVKRGLRTWYIWASVPCVMALLASGRYFVGVALVPCQLLIFHFVNFLSYRRAVTALAQTRGPNGEYVFDGAISQREQTAATIVDLERESGERES